MKKQITLLAVFLFPIIITHQFGKSTITSSSSRRNSFSPDGGPGIFNPASSVKPEEVGMKSATLKHIDDIVNEGIRARAFPGCQVLVLKDGKPIYDKCFGKYTYESSQEVKPTTIYDLASLTKTTGTLLAIMKLYDTGKLRLTDKASDYLTFLRGTDKENITIQELLFHESGLPATLPFYNLALEKQSPPPVAGTIKYGTHPQKNGKHKAKLPVYHFREDWVSKFPSLTFNSQVSDSIYVNGDFHAAAMQMIADARLSSKAYCYSCVNFIVLKEVAETICGESLDVFLGKEFYSPMNLSSMGYLPLRNHKKEEIAPTLKRDRLRNGTIQGFVHDPSAAFLGGVAGNAGLFASARDVAAVYQMLLNNGELNGIRYLSTETCQLFTTTTSESGRRDLGFDKAFPSIPNHSPCCTSAPSEVYGHTGYTGTCCWVDPVNKLVYVFLSNRTYPNDRSNKLTRMGIRSRIQEVIYQSMKS